MGIICVPPVWHHKESWLNFGKKTVQNTNLHMSNVSIKLRKETINQRRFCSVRVSSLTDRSFPASSWNFMKLIWSSNGRLIVSMTQDVEIWKFLSAILQVWNHHYQPDSEVSVLWGCDSQPADPARTAWVPWDGSWEEQRWQWACSMAQTADVCRCLHLLRPM